MFARILKITHIEETQLKSLPAFKEALAAFTNLSADEPLTPIQYDALIHSLITDFIATKNAACYQAALNLKAFQSPAKPLDAGDSKADAKSENTKTPSAYSPFNDADQLNRFQVYAKMEEERGQISAGHGEKLLQYARKHNISLNCRYEDPELDLRVLDCCFQQKIANEQIEIYKSVNFLTFICSSVTLEEKLQQYFKEKGLEAFPHQLPRECYSLSGVPVKEGFTFGSVSEGNQDAKASPQIRSDLTTKSEIDIRIQEAVYDLLHLGIDFFTNPQRKKGRATAAEVNLFGTKTTQVLWEQPSVRTKDAPVDMFREVWNDVNLVQLLQKVADVMPELKPYIAKSLEPHRAFSINHYSWTKYREKTADGQFLCTGQIYDYDNAGMGLIVANILQVVKENRTLHLVLILDNSGSMRARGESGQTRMESAIKTGLAISAMLKKLNIAAYITLIAFGHQIEVSQETSYVYSLDKEALAKWEDKLKAQQPTGTATRLGAAMEKAYDVTNPHENTVYLVVTDGAANNDIDQQGRLVRGFDEYQLFLKTSIDQAEKAGKLNKKNCILIGYSTDTPIALGLLMFLKKELGDNALSQAKEVSADILEEQASSIVFGFVQRLNVTVADEKNGKTLPLDQVTANVPQKSFMLYPLALLKQKNFPRLQVGDKSVHLMPQSFACTTVPVHVNAEFQQFAVMRAMSKMGIDPTSSKSFLQNQESLKQLAEKLSAYPIAHEFLKSHFVINGELTRTQMEAMLLLCEPPVSITGKTKYGVRALPPQTISANIAMIANVIHMNSFLQQAPSTRVLAATRQAAPEASYFKSLQASSPLVLDEKAKHATSDSADEKASLSLTDSADEKSFVAAKPLTGDAKHFSECIAGIVETVVVGKYAKEVENYNAKIAELEDELKRIDELFLKTFGKKINDAKSIPTRTFYDALVETVKKSVFFNDILNAKERAYKATVILLTIESIEVFQQKLEAAAATFNLTDEQKSTDVTQQQKKEYSEIYEALEKLKAAKVGEKAFKRYRAIISQEVEDTPNGAFPTGDIAKIEAMRDPIFNTMGGVTNEHLEAQARIQRIAECKVIELTDIIYFENYLARLAAHEVDCSPAQEALKKFVAANQFVPVFDAMGFGMSVPTLPAAVSFYQSPDPLAVSEGSLAVNKSNLTLSS